MQLELADRGRRARQRGNAFEREVAKALGGKRVGQFGTKVDVEAGPLRVQTKVGGSYPERLDRWLREVAVTPEEVAALVVGDSPGPGKPRRSLIVMDLGDFVRFVFTKVSHQKEK